MGTIRKPLISKTFGRLTVTSHLGGRRLACICECGNTVDVDRGNVLSGKTTSCGCLHKEKHTTHGHNKNYGRTPEYTAWMGMKRRCIDTAFKEYGNYGGRGITFCDRWKSFSSFLEDLGHRPSSGHTLDRIDNNGNYEPSNCRWATWKEQSRNKSNTRTLEFQGRRMCVTDWAQSLGINRNTLNKRLRMGWPTEKALSTAMIQ